MADRKEIGNLKIADPLHNMIVQEVLPGTGIDAKSFWQNLEDIIKDLGPKNRALLEKRSTLQRQIDEWHRSRQGKGHDAADYKKFLQEIGYLVPEGPDFDIETDDVDPEISTVAGPQLVVPVMNARFALNAANARWGSLYDALYGTDLISEDGGCEKGKTYNPKRGEKVVAFAAEFLDRAVPLNQGSHKDAVAYEISLQQKSLQIRMKDGSTTGLADPQLLQGFVGDAQKPSCILFKHHNLHVEIQIDPGSLVGQAHPAGVKDVVLESAVTTIQDCEDSVAAVDAMDKALVYRNWLGLIKGDLEEKFKKGDRTITRRLNPDRTYQDLSGQTFDLPGRSLLLVRNVGHLMTTNGVLYGDEEIPEGILDAMVTSLIAIHNINGTASLANSRTGSVYIVKPKMHGPEEVAFAVELFTRAEQALGLKPKTLKIGVMDEERRTTLNLKECIREAKERLIFINTGFLDRTGDEIHTSMEAGPMVPKGVMKAQEWMKAYEDWNVDVGLLCGLKGKAQIGKGMWAKPDEMAEMMTAKIGHPQSGANCAWVPSPTAATLHARHYH